MLCVTPLVMRSEPAYTVNVSLSFNGGLDWTVSTAEFTFVKSVDAYSVMPDFGPLFGGTPVTVMSAAGQDTILNQGSRTLIIA